MVEAEHPEITPQFQLEHEVICRLVEPNSKVLDLGCGNGMLLQLLKARKGVEGTGVEVSEEHVYESIRKGLTVFHGDVDEGLADFPDKSFDYVLLLETLQEVHKPQLVLEEMLRVGKKGIISFPNFAHWLSRIQLFFGGHAPITHSLPHAWYDSPNVQYMTIKDFLRFCEWKNYTIEKAVYLNSWREVSFMPNLRAEVAIFLIS